MLGKKEYLKINIDQLKEKSATATKAARHYNAYWKTCQGLIAFIGIITPMIVVYRKDSFFPQQFWVAWCIATPLLSTAISFLLSYFDWQGKASELSKYATLSQNLIERAENKLAFTDETHFEEFQQWLYEEKTRIEAMV